MQPRPSPSDASVRRAPTRLDRAAKRTFDVVVAGTALVVLSPLLLVVGLLVRTRLGRPVLFRQQRPGRGAAPFEILKFRTMTDARRADGSLHLDDERLTPFGRTLRRTSIDELPELFNVLRGEMSLVGPRPLLMEYLTRYTPEQARRHDVRPGLTGLAQISGRNATTWEERLRLDTWYVDHRSLALDLRIIVDTVAMVVRGHGVEHADSVTMPAFEGSPPTEV